MITSTQNSQVKHLVQLQNSAKARREADAYIVEGTRMVSEVPSAQLKRIYASESYFDKKQGSLPYDQICREHGWPEGTLEIVSSDVFRKISDTQTPQGILAVVKQTHYNIEETLSGKDDLLILALESVQNPGNVGTLLRSAEATGVDLVLLSEDSADVYNPKTIRGSMGSLLRVPHIYVKDLTQTLAQLPVTVYAAALEGANDYDSEDYSKGSAFLIGNEGNGLKAETIAFSDVRIRIPMAGNVESLNAGVAGSVLLYEAFRQRRGTR